MVHLPTQFLLPNTFPLEARKDIILAGPEPQREFQQASVYLSCSFSTNSIKRTSLTLQQADMPLWHLKSGELWLKG